MFALLPFLLLQAPPGLSPDETEVLAAFEHACLGDEFRPGELSAEEVGYYGLPSELRKWYQSVRSKVRVYKLGAVSRSYLVYFENDDAKGEGYAKACAVAKYRMQLEPMYLFARQLKRIADPIDLNRSQLANLQTFIVDPIDSDRSYYFRGDQVAESEEAWNSWKHYSILQISFRNKDAIARMRIQEEIN